MDELKYEKLTDVQGRLEANMIESYLEAQGVDVELFQESIGQSSYALTVDGIGRVQVFVPKEKMDEARLLLRELHEGIDEDEKQ
jgi:hypothetical protein